MVPQALPEFRWTRPIPLKILNLRKQPEPRDASQEEGVVEVAFLVFREAALLALQQEVVALLLKSAVVVAEVMEG